MKEILIKLNFIISKQKLKGMLVLTIFLFFGMILEVLGLAIILPTITTILDITSNNSLFPLLTRLLNLPDPGRVHHSLEYCFRNLIFNHASDSSRFFFRGAAD